MSQIEKRGLGVLAVIITIFTIAVLRHKRLSADPYMMTCLLIIWSILIVSWRLFTAGGVVRKAKRHSQMSPDE